LNIRIVQKLKVFIFLIKEKTKKEIAKITTENHEFNEEEEKKTEET
jgi:hypothetical protein